MNQISLRGVTVGSPAAQNILATIPPELKPCPFCKNAINFGLAKSKNRFGGDELQVECLTCGAKGPATEPKRHLAPDWQIAARVWNDYPSTRILPQ